ncbi:MAG TPA: flagellar hook basal-body protein [Dongiaceae bacterium]|nr:flagellar hook basal-body protein [Dongiaceae bacterium]
MDSGFYSAYTGFASRLDALDLLANNLANTNTPGYKAQFAFYRSLPAWLKESLTTPLNQAVNRYGALGGSRVDFSESNLESTGNPTDMALEGGGFFTLQGKDGVRFTRNGNFQLNAKRQLITQQGNVVLSEAGPIVLPAGQITVSQDGTISVDGGLVAKLRITAFPPDMQLVPEGSSYFVAPDGSGSAAKNVAVRQGALETSNTNPVRAAVSLIDLQRTAQMMEKALSIFHNEFNKTAAQELPRV